MGNASLCLALPRTHVIAYLPCSELLPSHQRPYSAGQPWLSPPWGVSGALKMWVKSISIFCVQKRNRMSDTRFNPLAGGSNFPYVDLYDFGGEGRDPCLVIHRFLCARIGSMC